MLPNLLLRNSASGSDKNLCFTNAALQILRNVPPFKQKCIEFSHYSNVHQTLKQIFDFEGSNKSVSAHPLRKIVGDVSNRRDFYSGQQSDALEFCEYLLQNLHPSILSLFRFKTTTLYQYWMNDNVSRCQHCGSTPDETNDEHLTLTLSFGNLHLYSDEIQLQQLINDRFSSKVTEQEGGMRCNKCCNHDSSIEHGKKCKPKPFQTTYQITRYPQYLILQLLRFEQTPTGPQKIKTKVTNCKSIDIQKTNYELISILNHEGTYQHGHYTALLKSDDWNLCDDIRQSSVSDAVESEKNYVYIFKKKEPDVSGLNQPEFIPTDEFQFVPPGVSIPKGCYVQMDFDGTRRAKLDPDGKKKQYETIQSICFKNF